MGDFNEILWTNEKEGGPPRNERQMRGIQDIVIKLGLRDMGYQGYKFTWKKRYRYDFIKVRLDRALASDSWRDLFSHSIVHHLAPSRSDHVPIIVKARVAPKVHYMRHRRFRFEEMWTTYEECENTI